MSIAINIDSIDSKNIYFYDEVENKVMENGIFIQTGYSNHLFSLSGIYINTIFNVNRVDKYFKKHKYALNADSNINMVMSLINLEKTILNSLDRHELSKTFKLKEQLTSSSILVFDNVVTAKNVCQLGFRSFVLKISGVWINDSSCGITFKFFHTND